jgi:DNA-binding transcriptional LysR family regulator
MTWDTAGCETRSCAAALVRLPGLRDRTCDLVLARIPTAVSDDKALSDLKVEALFHDPWVLAASAKSRWARRRNVDLAALLDEPWILPPADTSTYVSLAEALKARGFDMPTATFMTYSMELRAKTAARGNFITIVPKSVLRDGDDWHALTELAVDVPMRPWPVAVLTLKNRTLSPVVGRFIECTREVAKQ